MTWLMRILIGLGIALALIIAFVLLIGNWDSSGPPTQALTISVGSRTITVAGHFKSMTQESIADGIKVIVDGHEVVVREGQLTVDDKVQALEPDQNVTVYVSEDGKVQVKIVQDAEDSKGASEEAPE